MTPEPDNATMLAALACVVLLALIITATIVAMYYTWQAVAGW